MQTTSYTAMTNPLIEIKHPIAFDQIKAEHIESAIECLLQQAIDQKKELETFDGNRYHPFFDRLDRFTNMKRWVLSLI